MSKNTIIPIFVPHIGCPNACVFCNQKIITGKDDAEVNRNYVISIVEQYMKTRNKYTELAFFGGSFTAIDLKLQTELLEIAYFYKKKGYFDKIHMSTRPDAINEDILELQKKYSVDVIELGIQSLDEKVLKASNRGHTVADSINASKLIKSHGFILGHQVMPGLPASTYESDMMTCKKSIELEPDIVRIYPTLTIKQTKLAEMLENEEYRPLNLEEALNLSTKIYANYRRAGINVIRIGLQNTDTINDDEDVVGGPFHPAFRSLVEDRIYYDSIKQNLDKNNIRNVNEIEIAANSKCFNNIYGLKKANIIKLQEEFKIDKIKVSKMNIENGYELINDGQSIKITDKDLY